MKHSLPLLLLLALCQSAWSQSRNCLSDLRQALQEPDKVECLQVDLNEKTAERLIDNLHRWSNLRTLILSGEWEANAGPRIMSELADHGKIEELHLEYNQLRQPPEGLEYLPRVRIFSITGSPGLNYKQLFDKLSRVRTIEEIHLNENGLKSLPKTMSELRRVDRVFIEGNERLDFEKAIDVLAQMPRLTEIHLPINQITDLPPNIGELKQLEVLNLQHNILTGLTEKLIFLRNLDTLNLEGNLIVEHYEELKKVKGLDLQYLRLDNGLTDEERFKLQQLFPRAVIAESDDEGPEPEKPLTDPISEGDSERHVINLEMSELRVLSNAYLYYARLFNHPRFDSDFDSTLFEERYLDTTYANVWRRQPGVSYNSISLEKVRSGKKGEVWFDFKRDGKEAWNVYIKTNNPELNAFLPMRWVYAGGLTPTQFRRKYLGRNYWNDVRLYYDDTQKSFTLELKNAEGFDRITAYPRLKDANLPLSKSLRTYASRYEQYSKILQRRSDRFQYQLARERRNHERLKREKLNKAWGDFRNTYFSDAEKRMSKIQWLSYYDQVIGREKLALANAPATYENLLRRLKIAGYEQVEEGASEFWDGVSRYKFTFEDTDSVRIAESKVLIVDEDRYLIRQFQGNLGNSPVPVYLDEAAHCSFIVIARNGDIGLLPSSAFNGIDLRGMEQFTFHLLPCPAKLTTVGDVCRKLGH